LGPGERHGGGELDDVTEFVAGDQGQGNVGVSVGFDVDGTLKTGLVGAESLAQAAVEFGVAGFPEFVADVDAAKIDVAVAEFEEGFLAALQNSVNAATFFLLIRLACIEDNSIAGFERTFELDGD